MQFFDFTINPLILSNAIPVRKSLVDFRNLRTKQMQFLSESITERGIDPYGTLSLGEGIHLHFLLPDCFFYRKPDNTYCPSLNRWLVVRKRGQETSKWLIESDYLSVYGKKNTILYDKKSTILLSNPSTLLPLPKRILPNEFPVDVKAMGRVRSIPSNSSIPEPDSSEHYWKQAYGGQLLTSQGYGLSEFAIFYPNCFNVFGFYDKDGKKTDEYTIYGWNSYYQSMDSFVDKSQQPIPSTHEATSDEKVLLQDPALENLDYLFRAVVDFSTAKTGDVTSQRVKISAGNTLPQALNTALAHKIAPGNAKEVEQILGLTTMNLLSKTHLNPDLNYIYKRHQSTFSAKEGGILWQLVLQHRADSITPSKDVPLSDRYIRILEDDDARNIIQQISDDLLQLNDYQNQYNAKYHLINARQYNLFADWYKLVEAIHTNRQPKKLIEDLVSIINDEIKEIEALQTGSFNPNPNQELATIIEHIVITDHKGVEQKIKDVLIGLNNNITNKINPKLKGWKDADKNPVQDIQSLAFKLVLSTENKYYQPKPLALILEQTTGTDFYPMFLDWQVKLSTYKDFKIQSDQVTKRAYRSDLIAQNYTLQPNEQELVINKPRSSDTDTTQSCFYDGLTLLSSHSAAIAKNQFEAALANLSTSAIAENDIDKVKGYLNDALNLLGKEKIYGQVLNGLNQAFLMRDNAVQLPVYDYKTFKFDYRRLKDKGIKYRQLLEKIRTTVGGYNVEHAQGTWEFNPFRAGLVKPQYLHVFDSFGRYPKDEYEKPLNLYQGDMQISYDLIDSKNADKVALAPRLIQSTHLSFDWLDAETDKIVNNIPLNNPICGWIVANNLDQSLMIYDKNGWLLGQIEQADKDIVFQQLPFGQEGISVIKNKHLLNFVKQFTEQAEQKADYFTTMHKAINQSLEYIDPVAFAQYTQYALFASRPIALVRCQVQLATADALYSDQSSNAVEARVEPPHSLTYGYEAIKFPIQIGHAHLFNDGVLGYWQETSPQDPKFYASVATISEVNHPNAVMLRSKSPADFTKSCPQLSLNQRPTDTRLNTDTNSPLKLNLLFDPRGSLTLTSKILPMVETQIPHILFKAALENLQISFDSHPVITPKDRLHIPLLRDPHIHWKWIYRDTTDKKKPAKIIDQSMKISKPQYLAGAKQLFPELNPSAPVKQQTTLTQQLLSAWDCMVEKNWLAAIPESDQYYIYLSQIDFSSLPNDDKRKHDLTPIQQIVQQILENYADGILPSIKHTHLGYQTIQEGRLQINKS
ncbi:MAG: hypothetical protein AAF960_07735 [Bacteroidota bacterium]